MIEVYHKYIPNYLNKYREGTISDFLKNFEPEIVDYNIKDFKRGELRKMFGMVLQDTWLFEGTIRENLVYNKLGVTDEELDRVCKAVGLRYLLILSSGILTVSI